MTEFDNLTGMDVEGCLLTRVLGNGADGIVYAAQRDGREVAVKLFFPSAIKKTDRPKLGNVWNSSLR